MTALLPLCPVSKAPMTYLHSENIWMLGYQIKFNRQLKTPFLVMMNKTGIFFPCLVSCLHDTISFFSEKDKIHYKWEWGQLKESLRAPALIHRLETREHKDMSKSLSLFTSSGGNRKASRSTGLLCLVLTITVWFSLPKLLSSKKRISFPA